ncbi:hypothetical protein [Halorussus amylolyticus]|uniref:hypothetical protein n=1 Tax=Halorussus amylolyticus TaxID=1126242 RepID=UPI00104E62B7|nr:hypothetical protein [Halorussus amylolyticus]
MADTTLTSNTEPGSVRYLEALAVAAAFLHGGQDLMRGEPAELGIPVWLFAGGFFLYAVAIPFFSDRPRARVLLTGGVPLGIGVFHLFASHHGGFYMPITYSTLLFGGGVLVWYVSGN